MKKIPFLNNYYINEHGEVYSDKRGNLRKLKLSKDTSGYIRVGLYIKQGMQRKYLLHRLLAEVFIENPNKFEYVNHKDGDKLNNKLSNLEWCSSSYNQTHAYVMGLKTIPKGEDNGRSILTEKDVLEIYNKSLEGYRTKDLLEQYNVSESTLCDIRAKRNWRHITGDLPDIPLEKRSKRLSVDTIKWVCFQLQAGLTAPQIKEKATCNISLDRIWAIRSRRYYSDISKDFEW